MARGGQLYENVGKQATTWGCRFHHRGRRHYVTLGSSRDGYSRQLAERDAEYLMADVARGLWRPPSREPEPAAPREVPGFHEFASEWFENLCVEGGADGRGLSERGRADLRWRLSVHILPTFATYRLDQITVEDVDRFRRAKVAEGRLSPGSVNKMIASLSNVLEVAVEYGHIDRNPAAGRRRRLRVSQPPRTYLDRAEHVAALLDAAGALDRDGRVAPYRRPLLAVLVLAGLRIDEALSLRWRNLDLARGTLRVPGTKTAAAARTVDLLPALRDELLALAASRPDRPADGYVFATARGGKQSASNVRNRVLAPAVARANEALGKKGLDPLPDRLTPHSLRRTFASLLVAAGEDPAYVMGQMGHTTAHLTLAVYAREMRRRDGERERLRAVVGRVESGTSVPSSSVSG